MSLHSRVKPLHGCFELLNAFDVDADLNAHATSPLSPAFCALPPFAYLIRSKSR
jgi:hypothetical protein